MSEETSAGYGEEAGAAQMRENDGERQINEWFDLYYDQIYQYLYFMLGDRGGEAEDILQEVFIKAYRNLHTFKGDSSPRTWLTAIARNAAMDAMRRKRWTLNDLLAGREEKAPSAEEPERVLLTEERREKMLELLDVLKPAQREVIFFLYQKELSIKETAEMLDCTEAKIRTMKHRALRALRKSGEFEEWIGGELSNGD
ncbi:sigma-70 family RNA polymerase sigma factor [Saccharibacillus sp. CPCC 101409]|uniref:RNA polymerase sigma factor n=1 Tax=Saccharibacillus sp. CPCC 101409 TaxID=3058041 RepID=UPI002672FB1D|nr:sigma-70 family RNA polymerase sigma factor [Saccharibacillus sp. CPCC 101409]MDO3411288.1 sigma-70 family RNA polymerase sigma factor [Saccharibacillus sp. CPCC 101409]